MNGKNRGAVIIESVVVIPLLFLLILGLFEVNRIRSTQRILDSLAINVATEISSYPINETKIKSIIERHLKPSHMNIVLNLKSGDAIKYYINFYTNDYTGNSSPIYANNIINGSIIKNNDTDSDGNEQIANYDGDRINTTSSMIERGNDIVVTFCYKFDFLCALTCLAFTGSRDKPLYLYSRSRTKRL